VTGSGENPLTLAPAAMTLKGARMADEVLRERRGHIEILTINRPEARNAINGAVSRAMSSIMDELTTDDDCWVVILTGSGDKAFSAGMDLKAFSSGEGGAIMGASGGFGGLTQRDFPKPIIAAVNGSALAGGFEIMLSCDLVVAADHAMFGIPEAKRGLIAGAGGLIRLPKRLPIAVAYELAMTGDPIDAARAHALGLVNEVVPGASVLEQAIALAERIAANAPLAVRYSKSVMKRAAELPESDGWKINQAAVDVVFSSADAQEGPLAFAEKREARWQGK
jgi:enoyl-CoA hydratase/carnithine racemase